ncbi:MAG: ATP-binding cassette domain-containing protein [Spirochaetes bacterium]|jgi:ribose transport system ATP-binding protein|nr:ATP-binding cassette domain-containing protein [Spirochaetota bacterium]
MSDELVLSMRQIDKRFTGVHAVNFVDFDVYAGEVHALVGENGAGKSTLMKILTGIHERDSGEIIYLGRPFNPRDPKHALDLGIGIIHQELNMMDLLTVAENLFIGRESMQGNGVLLDKKEQNRRAAELFARLNMNIDPTAQLGRLTIGKQQMVEIARAVSHNLQLLILDEPTAALTDSEIEELFSIMRGLRERGVGMIHISHRLDEIHQIADRTSVMRDGEMVGTRNTNEITKQDIISMMVGRVIYEEPKTKSRAGEDAEVALRVHKLNAGPLVKDVSFEVRRGEILGFAGLMGAGRTETARAVFGADPIESGTIEVNGKPVRIESPSDAVAEGIGYLSEDRKRFGLALNLTVKDNIVLTTYDRFMKGPFLDWKKIGESSAEYIERLDIKTPSVDQIIRNLSGGNQQKVVLAKWLIRNSDILIFDEPTRGIDVGAKSEIYHLMNELASQGKAIIMISSELPEILRMSDRIVVMCEGRVTGELEIGEADQGKIMEYATMWRQETFARS